MSLSKKKNIEHEVKVQLIFIQIFSIEYGRLYLM